MPNEIAEVITFDRRNGLEIQFIYIICIEVLHTVHTPSDSELASWQLTGS